MMAFLILLATLIGCCSAVICLEALIQEDPGVGNLVTVCAFIFISLDGFVNELKFGHKKLNVPVSEWLTLVVLFFLVNVINNASFSFNIAMPLYMVFKSGSLAASLITEKFVLGRQHSTTKHIGVLLITLGIMICTYSSSTYGTKDGTSLDWAAGIFLLSTSLVLGARMGIYQEQIYATWGRHHREGLFFTHFLPLPGFLLLASDIKTHMDIVLSSPKVMFGLPRMLLFLMGNILSQYVCARSIFWLSSHYSSLTITMILTLRKFCSILLSVWLFNNIFTIWHWLGAILVFIGTLLFSNIHEKFTKEEKIN